MGKLKPLLISDFDPICNSAELHELLLERKMRYNELLDIFSGWIFLKHEAVVFSRQYWRFCTYTIHN